MLRKVPWADSWVITVTTQESAHATLRSIKTTLFYIGKFKCQNNLVMDVWIIIFLKAGLNPSTSFLLKLKHSEKSTKIW